MTETTYADRTDSFEEKLKLIAAWKNHDYRLARSLAHSLRDSAIQAQIEEEDVGQPLATKVEPVESLPKPWRDWARGWKWCRAIHLDEPLGIERSREPVELLLSFPVDQVASLAREVRVARLHDGVLTEVPSQVYGEMNRGDQRLAKVLFMAGGSMHERQSFLVFHGNPDAELPEYPSDLETRGEGYALDIENEFYKASLSHQMGQLERMTIKRDQGLELFAGGDGHGEPPGIDWAHDYASSGHFQKFRITLWESCPDYEVVRGPLATIVRRWGFPHSPVHPVFTPARLHVDVEYRFYSGVPWFHKVGKMRALKTFEAAALRDDEWVFSGYSFTDPVWMGPDGKLRIGKVEPGMNENLWGVGLVNPETHDSIIALYLEHRGEDLPELKHTGTPNMLYRPHGQVWSRYPLPVKEMPAGAVLTQKNAYVMLPFTADNGPRMIEDLRHQLVNPMIVTASDVPKPNDAKPCPGRLARIGEANDSPISKHALWEALSDCKDSQLYTADISVIDLGLVLDLRVRGDTVHVLMTMPHRGRPRIAFFSSGSGGNPNPVQQRLLQVPGVKRVVVEQTWHPGWSSNAMTDEGRRKFGMKV